MIKLGEHSKLREALIKKRGSRTKKEVAAAIGISVTTYSKLESGRSNTDYHTQHLARYWVNHNKGFYEAS